jgi:dTDP-4-dehydrorhamnose reductase
MSDAAVASPETLAEVLASPRPQLRERRRVLVTGASGMLGADVSTVLAGAGMTVFARPRSDLDITDPGALDRAFRQLRPEVVINCAAFTKVDACESNPEAFAVNAQAVESLAERCLRDEVQLVQISTDFVFDGTKRTPYTERDPAAPLSEYGRSKHRGETAALTVPGGLVVRSSWLFGLSGWNFIEAILKQVEEGKKRLTVVFDQRGRPTATADLAEAILALMDAGASGVCHFANRGEVSWLDFARVILDFSGHAEVEVEPIDSVSLGRPAKRPAYSVLDTSRYETLTGRTIRHFTSPLAEYLAQRERSEA